uniref:Transposase n=1 Tax=Ditylenchus dipsaci TaxID=166011 RepID=A0A915EAL2_9BILA
MDMMSAVSIVFQKQRTETRWVFTIITTRHIDNNNNNNQSVNLSGWYEGFSDGPYTNNGLESNNRVIKDCHTLRRRLLLPAFFRTVEKMMQSYSGDSNDKPPVTTPDVPSQLFREAFLLE